MHIEPCKELIANLVRADSVTRVKPLGAPNLVINNSYGKKAQEYIMSIHLYPNDCVWGLNLKLVLVKSN